MKLPHVVWKGYPHGNRSDVNRGDINYLYTIFGNTIQKDKGKRTNKEFIIAIADLLTPINK